MCSIMARCLSVFTLCVLFNAAVSGKENCCAPQIIIIPPYGPWYQPNMDPRQIAEYFKSPPGNPSPRNGFDQFKPPNPFSFINGAPYSNLFSALAGNYAGAAASERTALQFEIDEFQSLVHHPNWKYFDRETCGETLEDRIIGGTEASLGQYPWLGVIGYKSSLRPEIPVTYSCGAALINSCWVVSAAHCVHGLPASFYVYHVRLGEHDLDSDMDCNKNECAPPVQDFAPSKIIYNNNFNNPKLQNDISLIKLNRPVEFTRWISPICLPYGDLLTKILTGQMAEVAGWGISNIQTNETSKVLQTVKLPIVANEKCQQVFRKKATIVDSQLCVGGRVGMDSCNGDSGGPLMKVDVVGNGSPKYYIFGLVSFGINQCGVKPAPAVYTRITGHLKWLLDHVSQC